MSRRETVCGPDCRYRSLYEGTQSSLTDIASKQAEALGRVGRLRNGMISILNKNTLEDLRSQNKTQAVDLTIWTMNTYWVILNKFLK